MISPPGYYGPAWLGSRRGVSYSFGCAHFADLVRVRANGAFNLFDLIYDVNVHDDPVVRQLILVDVLESEPVLDQRENRLAPIELSILTVGCLLNGKIIQGLPPQPPINLDSLVVWDEAELREFTDDLTYLHLVLNTTRVPADELLVVNLTQAAATRLPEMHRYFLIEAGRELVRR